MGSHLGNMLAEATACFETKNDDGETFHPLPDFIASTTTFYKAMQPFLDTIDLESSHTEVLQQLRSGMNTFSEDVTAFQTTIEKENTTWKTQDYQNGVLKATSERLLILADTSHNLVK